MKHILSILLLTCFLFSSCEENNEITKTPGEINGEKIMEYVTKHSINSVTIYELRTSNGSTYYQNEGSYENFKVEGQFLTYSYGNLKITKDLNKLEEINYSVQWGTSLTLYFGR